MVKLRHEFESVCSNLLVQISSPSLDVCLNELLREEQHHLTQATLEQQESSTNVQNVAHVAQVKRVCNMSNTQCYNCEEFGHTTNQWPHKFYNYCKIKGNYFRMVQASPKSQPSCLSHLKCQCYYWLSLILLLHNL